MKSQRSGCNSRSAERDKGGRKGIGEVCKDGDTENRMNEY